MKKSPASPLSAGTLIGAGLLAAGLVARRRARNTLRGQVALVTGGSRGLGLELARELARRGVKLALCARDVGELGQARAELLEMGAKVLVLPCDVTDRQQIERTVEIVRKHYGCLDILVNNAGVIQVGPQEEMSRADYESAMKIHFWAPLNACFAALPVLRSSRGRIINIASVGGKVPVPHLLPYVASKYALTGFSEGLGVELAQAGVSVTTVLPGTMRTGGENHAQFRGRPAFERAWFSTAANFPGLSISARHAARVIVEASARRKSEVVVGAPARALVRLHTLAPAVSLAILSGVSRRLGSSARVVPPAGSRAGVVPKSVETDRNMVA